MIRSTLGNGQAHAQSRPEATNSSRRKVFEEFAITYGHKELGSQTPETDSLEFSGNSIGCSPSPEARQKLRRDYSVILKPTEGVELMKRINKSRFEVQSGEVVTVKLVATNIGDTAVFTIAPAHAIIIDPSPRAYRFTALGDPGDINFGLITCDFTAAQPGARFKAVVSSPGFGPFDGPTIRVTDPDSEEPVAMNFEIPDED